MPTKCTTTRLVIGAPRQNPIRHPHTGLVEAAVSALRREGMHLATYDLGGSPLGYKPLRELVAGALTQRAALGCDPDEVLITSGSLQAMDLVNATLVAPGDTVIVEEATYGGMLSRLHAAGAQVVGVRVNCDGLDTEHLAELLERWTRHRSTSTPSPRCRTPREG